MYFLLFNLKFDQIILNIRLILSDHFPHLLKKFSSRNLGLFFLVSALKLDLDYLL